MGEEARSEVFLPILTILKSHSLLSLPTMASEASHVPSVPAVRTHQVVTEGGEGKVFS